MAALPPRLAFVLAVAALGFAAATAEVSFGDVTQDDAYISYRYARNLAEGRGLVYNAGERVEGFSNFLWTLIIAAAVKGGAAAPTAGRWLGIAASLAAVALTAALGRRYAGPYGGVLAAAMLAANATFWVESAQGLETAFFVVLVTLAAWRVGEEYAHADRKPVSAAFLILALLTRPEGALVWLVALPFYVATARANRRRFALWLAAFVVVAAAYEGWRLAYYGSFFPNTFYAKVAPGWDALRTGGPYAATFLLRFTPALLFLPLAARQRREFYPWFALAAAYIIYVTVIGGDMLPTDRFFQPIIPLVLVAAATAAADLAAGARWVPRWTWAVLGVALVATQFLGFLPGWEYGRAYRRPHALYVAAGQWLAANAPPGATLACPAAGIIPYYSRLPTVDLFGLTDRYIARHGRRAVALPGHGLSAVDYVLDRRPTYILPYGELFAEYPLTEEEVLAGAPWPAARELAASPRFRAEYVLSRAEITPGEWFHYFVRAVPLCPPFKDNPSAG